MLKNSRNLSVFAAVAFVGLIESQVVFAAGAGPADVAIVVAGVPLSDHFSVGNFSNATRDFIDAGLIENIEVLHGPASALYGSSAIGGVVAVKKPDPVDLVGTGRNGGDLLVTWRDLDDLLGEVFPLRDFPISSTKEIGAYLEDTMSFGDWTVIAALRADRFELSPGQDPMYLEDYPFAELVSLTEADLFLTQNIGSRTTLRAGLHNLTDRTYWNWSDVRGLSPNDPILPYLAQAGRSASVSLNVNW